MSTTLDIKIKAAIEGLNDLLKFKDSFQDLITELEHTTQPSNQAARNIREVSDAAKNAASPMSDLEKQANIASKAIQGITAAKSLEEVTQQAKLALASVLELGEQGSVGLGGLDGEATGVTEEMLAMQGEVNSLVSILGSLSRVQSLEELQQTAEHSARELDILSTKTGRTSNSLHDLANANSKVNDAADGAADSLQSIAENAEDAADGSQQGAIGLGDMADAADDASATLGEVADAADDAATPLSNLEQQAKVAQDAISSITSAESLEEIKAQAEAAVVSLIDLKEQGVEQFGELDDEATIVTQDMTQLQDEVDALTAILGRLSRVNSLEELEDVAKRSAHELDILTGNTGDVTTALRQLTQAANLTDRSLGDTADGLQSIAQNGEDAADGAEAGADGLGDLGDAAQNAQGDLEDVADAADTAAASTDSLGDSQQDAGGSSSTLGSALSGLRDWFGQVTDGSSGFLEGLREYTNVGPTVTGVVGGLVDTLGTFKEQLALVVAGIVAFAAVAGLKESADLAARIETLGVTMEVVGKNAGYTKEQLDGYEKEVKALGITSEAARDTIIQMTSAGLELGDVTGKGSSQVAQLARASQDLAVIMGGSSSETLQQMITNIQQLDTEGLRYMGIILDQGQAQEKYALQLGTTVGALTNAQKQQAAMNEVMAQAAGKVGTYEAAMDTVGKQLGSLTRYKDELAEAIGNKLLPAYGALVKNTTDYLKDLKEVVNNTDKAGVASDNWATAMDGLSKLVFGVMKATVEIMADANQGFSILGATIGDLLSDFANLFDVMDAGEDSILSIGKVLGGFSTVVAGILAALKDTAVIIVASFVGVGSAVLTVVGTIIEGLGRVLFFVPYVGSELRKVGASWREVGTEGYNASAGVIDNIIQGNGALGEFNKRILEANDLMEKAKKTGAYATIEEEIVKLLGAQRQGTMQSYELVEASNNVAAAMKQMAAEGKLTEKDILVLGSKLAAVGNKDLDQFNQALKLIGTTSQELRNRITADFGEIVGGLKELAKNSNTTSDDFYGAFDQSIDSAETINDIFSLNEALLSYQERLKDAGKLSEEEMASIRQQSQLLLEKFNEVFKEGLDTAKTSADFADLAEDTKKLGEEMIKAGVMTEDGLKLKLAQIEEQAQKTGKALEFKETIQALDALGISFDELTTGISDNTQEIVDALDQIIVQGQLTSEQLRKVFDNAIGQAKTLDDLEAVKSKIKDAFEQGKLSVSDFKSATTDAGTSFVKIFREEMNTATTRQEIDALRTKIQEMGSSGAISAKEVSFALGELAKKAQEGRQSVLELAQAASNMGAAQLKAVQSQNEAYKAMVDASKAYNALEEARNAYYQEGTELNREIMELKQIEYEIALQSYAIAQSQAELDQQNITILIAQQKMLRAEKEATMATDAVAAQARITQIQNEIDAELVKAQALTQNMQKQQQVLSNMQGQKHAQEQVVAEAQKTSDEAGKTAEKTKEAKNETDKFRESMAATGASIANLLNSNLERSVNLLKEAGFTHKEALQRGMELQDAFVKGLRGALNGSLTEPKMWWDMMEAKLQDTIKYKESAIARSERQAELDAQSAQRTSDITSNAQRMAELGYDANVSWQAFVNEGLASTSSTLQKLQAQAKQTIKDAQDSVKSFMSSVNDIKLEYLQATGQEEEALAMRYAARKQELALEYEMLKVKITAAKITAKQAGESTAVLDSALQEAKAGYDQALKYLTEMEKMEKAALEKKKADEADAAKKAAEEELAAKSQLTADKSDLSKELASAIAQAIAKDPNKDGKDDSGNPIKFVLDINGKKIEATTESSETELISVLEQISKRV